jgi:hypothetical protein
VVDHSQMKLGRRPAKFDARVPKFSNYLASSRLPPPPPVCDWSTKVTQWGMLKNDEIGDCTAAGCGHAIQLWSANASAEANITDDDTISFYERSCGYDPANPDSDHGGVELDVLNYWQRNDFAGHKLDAFASLDVGNRTNIKDAIWLTGGVYIGVNLPISAQTQDVWDIPQQGTAGDGKPGSWGGHAIYAVGFTDQYVTCVTWGQLKTMTWAFWNAYVEEAWTLISMEWIMSNGISPSGFRYDDLIADMKALDADQNPLDRLRQEAGDPVLFEFHWRDITVDVNQAAATYALGLIASILATYGYMTDSSITTFFGTVVGVLAGFYHLAKIGRSNTSTKELVDVFAELIAVLQRRKVH